MIQKATCGMCQGGCQVNVTVEDGRLVKLEPDTDSPRGRLCARGALAPQLLYGEGRLTTPLIRTGRRGEGKFRAASWDEALDYAAERLQSVAEQYGGRALASYFGRGVLGTPVTRFGPQGGKDAFLAQLGSPNDMSCSSICNLASSTVTPVTVLGLSTRQMVQDVEHSDCIFSWGKNSATDDGPQIMLKRIQAARARGAKLVVIDPRQAGLGEIADLWVPVTPGSDGALALAMLKLIVDSGRYDHSFVEQFTLGFDRFKAYLDTLTLTQLSGWCGVSREQIEQLTDLFCSTSKISLVSYTGLEYQLSAIQNNRAIYILWAITGKLDVEGGIYLNARGLPTLPLKDAPPAGTVIGADEFPLFYRFTGTGQFSRFPRAVLKDDPYPVRGLLILGGSPMLSFPDSQSWRAAYEKLDCLLVLDRFLTEDARYADVVFPACSLFEVPRTVSGPDGPILREPVIPPVGEARNDVLILAGLARRLGFGHLYPQTEQALREWLLNAGAPFGFARGGSVQEPHYEKYKTGQLRADGQPGFPTPSGKLEICSTLLEEAGFTPYPEYRDIRSIPALNRPEFPFTLTSGARSNHRMGVFGPNMPSIAAIEPCPLLELNSEDAAELGIADGARARVTTPFGSGVYKVKVCGMARRAIHIPHGGGSTCMPEPWKNGNVNDLCSLDYHDPITGFVTIKSVPCRVEAV